MRSFIDKRQTLTQRLASTACDLKRGVMAGSSIEVLLASTPSDEQRDDLRRFLALVASEVEGDSFWIAGQPYDMYECVADDEIRQLSLGGFLPKFVLGFCAGCRGRAADYFLAMLAIRVAELLGGLIAFGGSLEKFTSSQAVLTLEGRFASAESGDVLTTQFLRAWVADPDFRMVN